MNNIKSIFNYAKIKSILKNKYPQHVSKFELKHLINEVGINIFYLSKGDIYLSNIELSIFLKNTNITNYEDFYCVLKNRINIKKTKISFNSYDEFKKLKIEEEQALKKIHLNERKRIDDENQLIKDGVLESRQIRKFKKIINDSFMGAKIIASLDCEFITRKGTHPILTEVGIVKYDINTNEIKTKHFILNNSNHKSLYNPYKQHELSLIKQTYISDLQGLSMEVSTFLNDVDLIAGHDIKNDIDVLESNNVYNNKDIKTIDTQKLIQLQTNDNLSLFNSLNYMNVKFDLNAISEKHILKILEIIEENEEKKTFRKKKRVMLFDKIFLHTAFNDAFLTIKLLFKMLKLTENQAIYYNNYFFDFIKKEQNVYNKNLKKYLENLSNNT